MIWEIYSYWNIQELRGVFEAIAMITNTDNFSTLLGAALLFGLAGAAVAVLTGVQDLVAGFRWFIVSLFLYFVFFVPKADVALIDRTGTTGASIVTNVPLSIAVFGHVTSKIGDWLTTSYETTMQVIVPAYALEGVAFQNNGLLFGEKVLMEAENARSENISFRMNMSGFFDKCVFPEFDTGQILINDVLKEPDMWAQLSNVNPSLYVQLYNASGAPDGAPVNCVEAYTSRLPAMLNNASNEVVSRLGSKLYPDKATALANASLQSAMTGSYGYYLNVSASATDIIKQKVLSNTFFDTNANSGVVLASAMTEAGAKMNYGVLYNVAQSAIPKLRNVIEVVLYAVFPIILLMIIVGGTKGLVVVKSYFISLLWIQLWAPLYAVMNFMVSSYNAKELVARAVAGKELNAWDSAGLQQSILGSADIAGMLAVSIPMIAYAIVKGGEMAMTSFVGGATKPLESNAGASAREVANGNLSLGNMSMDNKSIDSMSAFKHDMQPSVNNGPNVRMDGMGNQITTTEKGGQFLDTTRAQNSGAPFNLTSAVSERNGYSAEYDKSIKAAQKSSTQANFEVGSSFGDAGLISKAAGGGKEWNEAFGNKYDKGTQQAFSKMDEIAKGLERSGKVGQGEGAELVAALGAKGGIGLSTEAGFLAQAQANLGKKYSSQAIAEATEGLKSIDKSSLNNVATIMQQTSESDNVQQKLGVSNEARTELKAGRERSEGYKQAEQAELEKAESHKEKMTKAEEKVVQAMYDMGAAIPFSSMNEAGKRFALGAEGSAYLAQAMEARNRGDANAEANHMARFNTAHENYMSQYSVNPTGKNIGDVPSQGNVVAAHNENQEKVLTARGEYQGLVNAGGFIDTVGGKQAATAGELKANEQWVAGQKQLHENATNAESNITTRKLEGTRQEIKDDKNVKDLDKTRIDEYGSLRVDYSQNGRVAVNGGASIVDTFKNVPGASRAAEFLGINSLAQTFTEAGKGVMQVVNDPHGAVKKFNEFSDQRDSANPNHTSPGAGIAGTPFSVESQRAAAPFKDNPPEISRVDTSGDVPVLRAAPASQPQAVQTPVNNAPVNNAPVNNATTDTAAPASQPQAVQTPANNAPQGDFNFTNPLSTTNKSSASVEIPKIPVRTENKSTKT
ncbi:conjugal transfer protein TraG N-terminal domain-containing protein [Thiomicrorhabdus aquaedulcis]|uniref:conjugal transfer protein TraG N-terminal domain-containing protein n=1 Tax=Thiomicrorhabdus aquaedulcis TaxID=2211106 RepID=UPI000FD76E5D|nr:conjugal transfer protein TraG N-terminal domain-containing protein [Thiomicrorhabdus aquaedulcis]